jgi:hypothetical protein
VSARAAVELAGGQVRLDPSGYDDLLFVEPRSKIRIGDALLANIDLSPANGSSAHLLRKKQSVLPLAHREIWGAYREVTQLQLLERAIVLCHETMRDRVSLHLEQAARTGFKEYSTATLPGLPEKWVAFTDVEIVNRVEADGLEALTPFSDRQFLLSGGLSLGQNTWHKTSPPEVKAAATDLDSANIFLETQLAIDRSADKEDRLIKTFRSAATLPLLDLNLGDGSYTVVLKKPGETRHLAQAILRLRSAATARPVPAVASSRLAYVVSADQAKGVMSAQAADIDAISRKFVAGTAAVVGSKVFGEAAQNVLLSGIGSELPTELNLSGEIDDGAPGGGTVLTTRTHLEGDCAAKGYHYWRFETVPPGAGPNDPVHAQCIGCGREFWRKVRLSRKNSRQTAERRTTRRPTTTPLRPAPLPDSVTTVGERSSIGADVLLDAMCYMRVGSWQAFKTMAASVDDSAIYAFELARTLAALAHIDLELDSLTCRPSRWSVSPTVFAQLRDGRFLLCGWRSEPLVAQIRSLVESENGGTTTSTTTELGVPVIEISGCSMDAMRAIADLLAERIGSPIYVERDAAMSILRASPPISAIAPELIKASLPSHDLEAFDLRSARWAPIPRIAEPGAYRAKLRGQSYLYVGQTEFLNDTGRLGDPRLTKHLAARDAGVSLISYADASRELSVPLGCELPGLLERVATLCSGRAPIKVNGQRKYRDVSRDVAEEIWKRLTA